MAKLQKDWIPVENPQIRNTHARLLLTLPKLHSPDIKRGRNSLYIALT